MGGGEQRSMPGRIWGWLQRYSLGIPILLGFVLAGGVALAFLIGGGFRDPAAIEADSVDDYEVGLPKYFEIDRFWIVRLEGDEILALYDKNPQSQCRTLWFINEEFMGTTGWFNEPCQDHLYDYTGRCFDSECTRGLDRFEVEVTEEGAIFVDLSRLNPGPEYNPDDVPLVPPQS